MGPCHQGSSFMFVFWFLFFLMLRLLSFLFFSFVFPALPRAMPSLAVSVSPAPSVSISVSVSVSLIFEVRKNTSDQCETLLLWLERCILEAERQKVLDVPWGRKKRDMEPIFLSKDFL